MKYIFVFGTLLLTMLFAGCSEDAAPAPTPNVPAATSTAAFDTLTSAIETHAQATVTAVTAEGKATVDIVIPDLRAVYDRMTADGIDMHQTASDVLASQMLAYIDGASMTTVTVTVQAVVNADGNWEVASQEAVDAAVRQQLNELIVRHLQTMEPITVETEPTIDIDWEAYS